MIAAAIALLLIGILLGFFVPPFGFIPAAVGLVLLVAFLAGWGRTAARETQSET
jgi:hypothetical protein